MPTALAFVVCAYLVGTFPTAQIVGRRMGHDPTAEGSGNPGASNVWRLSGRRAGVVVGVVDLVKGLVPTLVALVVADRATAHAAWIAAVVGHVWPVQRRFRGGKGVATAGGGGLALSPPIGIACALVFLVVVKLGRVAALGSLTIGVVYPVAAAVAGWPWGEVASATVVALILVVRHRSNISELVGAGEGAHTASATGD